MQAIFLNFFRKNNKLLINKEINFLKNVKKEARRKNTSRQPLWRD